MRAVEVMAAALRFLGVFDGVGSIVTGSMVGGARVLAVGCEGLSESDCALLGPACAFRELNVCFLGVL